MFRLRFHEGEYLGLRQRLLASAPREAAAFVYFASEDGCELRVSEVEILSEQDFVVREADYLEVTDAARQGMIRTAHQRGLGVAEFHSHPFPLPAEFSYADHLGLRDTVPHMLWRLKQRPYVAAVVGPSDFDGLVWLPDQSVNQLVGIIDGFDEFASTRRSISQWL